VSKRRALNKRIEYTARQARNSTGSIYHYHPPNLPIRFSTVFTHTLYFAGTFLCSSPRKMHLTSKYTSYISLPPTHALFARNRRLHPRTSSASDQEDAAQDWQCFSCCLLLLSLSDVVLYFVSSSVPCSELLAHVETGTVNPTSSSVSYVSRSLLLSGSAHDAFSTFSRCCLNLTPGILMFRCKASNKRGRCSRYSRKHVPHHHQKSPRLFLSIRTTLLRYCEAGCVSILWTME